MDRLTLNEARLEGVAQALVRVAGLPDPVGQVTDYAVRPNGLRIRRMSVPLGVVAIIYDAEDNAIAASRTVVENLAAQSSSSVTFTWPTPFPSPAVRKEIILRIYPAGATL